MTQFQYIILFYQTDLIREDQTLKSSSQAAQSKHLIREYQTLKSQPPSLIPNICLIKLKVFNRRHQNNMLTTLLSKLILSIWNYHWTRVSMNVGKKCSSQIESWSFCPRDVRGNSAGAVLISGQINEIIILQKWVWEAEKRRNSKKNKFQ